MTPQRLQDDSPHLRDHDVEGWRVRVTPGWFPWPSTPTDVEIVTFSQYLDLPRTFSLIAAPPYGQFRVVLHFGIHEKPSESIRDIRLVQALCLGDEDLVPALDKLRKTRPMDFWLRHAVVLLANALLQGETLALAQETGRELLEQLENGGDAEPWFEHMEEAFREAGPGLVAAVHEANTLRLHKPQRRNRITDDHLRQVADVYAAATADGRPPTQAVSDHFETSHSTAARWVGLARGAGHLPPANRNREQ